MPHSLCRPISLLFGCRSSDELKQDVFEISHPVLGRHKGLLLVATSYLGDRMEMVIT